jgi:hypothetical protein
MTFSSVFATSSNNNDDISNKDQSQDGNTDKESTDNNDHSSDTQSEQNNPCSNETIEGVSFIDENGCRPPCPNLEDQPLTIVILEKIIVDVTATMKR